MEIYGLHDVLEHFKKLLIDVLQICWSIGRKMEEQVLKRQSNNGEQGGDY